MKKYLLVSFVFILGLFILNINSVYALKDGCTANSRYSITTGESCGGNIENTFTSIPSCSSISGYNLITGQQASCSVLTKATAVFNFKAKDPEGDNLTWSMNWGDGKGLPEICPSSQPNTNLSVGHSWSMAGTYKVTLGVSDCKSGTAKASFNVVVKDHVVSTPATTTDIENNSIPPAVSTPTTDSVGLKGEFISPLTIRLSWNPIHTSGYKGGYNIYKNGFLFARTRTDFIDGVAINDHPTLFYDNAVTCPSTQRYMVELFSYDNNWKIIPSGKLSDVATVTSTYSSCPSFITKVIYPNGGETYKKGDTLNIKWKATGLGSNNSVAVSVYKYRSDNNYYGVSPAFGVTWNNDYTKEGTLDEGSYNWKIPSTFTTDNYVIWVSGANATQDTSDVSFSIN